MFQDSKFCHSCSNFLFLATLLAFLAGGRATYAQTGLPGIAHYAPERIAEAGIVAGPQMLLLDRDHKGRLIIANREGVLVYDGAEYWKIPDTRRLGTAKFAANPAGEIFIGGVNDLGYLQDDQLGRPTFHSLKERFPEVLPDDFRIYQTVLVQEKAFFMAPEFVAVWDGKRLQKIPARGKNYRLLPVGPGLYLHDREAGLLRWTGTEFIMEEAEGGWQTIRPKGMAEMTGYWNPEWLVVSRKQGLFRHRSGALVPLASEANALLQQTVCYNVAVLPDGKLALATYGEGLLILDQAGQLLHQIREAEGLADPQVVNVTYDGAGSLWLGLNNGYARLAYPSAWSRFDRRNGLPGNVLSLEVWQGKLYAGTSAGLFAMPLEADLQAAGRFVKIKEIQAAVHAIKSIGGPVGGLLVASGEGVWWGSGESFSRLAEGVFKSLLVPGSSSGRMYAGGRNRILEFAGKHPFEVADTLVLARMTVNGLAADGEGGLWATEDSILRVETEGGSANSRKMSTEQGWTAGMTPVQVTGIAGENVFYTPEGCWVYAREKDALQPYRDYGGILAGGAVDLLAEVGTDSLFLARDGAAGLLTRVGEEWIWDTLAFQALPFTSLRCVRRWGNTLWLGSDAGLFRYEMGNEQDFARPFQVMLRTVAAGDSAVLPLDGRAISLGAAANDVRFAFTASEFDRPEAVVYRHRLQGYSEAWSGWSGRNFAEYTNLPSGDFVFAVQARNHFGTESQVVEFAFHLATPWYRQTWAYLLYALLGLLAIVGVVRLRTRQLRRAKARLEHIVAERTSEIAAQKAQIVREKEETERQRDRAEESERVKKRFFANMTHELRTPLTLILGPLAQLRSAERTETGQQQLSLIERNGKRLLRLINQLLDISRVESERMTLHPVRRDLVRFVEAAVANFVVAARDKEISLEFTSAFASLEVDFDPEKLEKVLFNLLSNAVKFTEQGGVRLELSSANSDERVRLTVEDSGRGIPEAEQGFVFDRFYQSEHGKAGTGIGLALTRELVQLHGGKIGVESKVGEGSTFWVELPLRQDGPNIGKQATTIPETHSPENKNTGSNLPETRHREKHSPVFQKARENASLYLVDDPHAPAETSPPTAEEALAEDAGNLVLVVEDNADVRAYISSCIPPEYRVMEAVDGAQGLEMATRWVPDLVVSDLMMPGLDGYELTAALKSSTASSHVPVILLTSRAEAESRLQGLETGADAYLTKPFDPAELQVRIRKLIALRATLREKFRGEVLLQPAKVQATSTEETFLLQVKSLIAARFGDEQLQVEDMAQAAHLSKVQFSRKFKALTGTTPNKYLRKYRLDTAHQLIEQNAGTMAEIAFQVGFSSAAYFSKCFMDEFGVSPSSLGKS